VPSLDLSEVRFSADGGSLVVDDLERRARTSLRFVVTSFRCVRACVARVRVALAVPWWSAPTRVTEGKPRVT
jgi:hypothetical protein